MYWYFISYMCRAFIFKLNEIFRKEHINFLKVGIWGLRTTCLETVVLTNWEQNKARIIFCQKVMVLRKKSPKCVAKIWKFSNLQNYLSKTEEYKCRWGPQIISNHRVLSLSFYLMCRTYVYDKNWGSYRCLKFGCRINWKCTLSWYNIDLLFTGKTNHL